MSFSLNFCLLKFATMLFRACVGVNCSFLRNPAKNCKRARLLWRLLRRCADRQIWTHFLQALFGNTFHREKVVNFLKGAALLAEIYDGFAMLGPISGTCCNSSAIAEFKSTECAGSRRLVSASDCTSRNISRKETAINVRDGIRHVRGFKSSDTISLRVVLRDRAEESGLVRDLCAVADENDLLVGGIEMAAGGCQNIVRCERLDSRAISFQIIFR